MVGWDNKVTAPGQGFVLKGVGAVSTEGWHRLVQCIDWKDNPHRDPMKPKLDIIPWSDRELN